MTRKVLRMIKIKLPPLPRMIAVSLISTALINIKRTPANVMRYMVIEMSSLLFVFNNLIVCGKADIISRGAAK